MHNPRLAPRAVGALFILAVLLVPFLPTSTARGDEIDDLKSRAAQVSSQISDLQAQVASATAAVEKANYEASQIADKIDQASKQLAQAKRDEAASRRQLANFALNAYISGGSGSVDLATLLDTENGKLGARQGYQSSAVGDRQELVDQLEAAQQVTSDRAATLRGQKAKAAAVAEQAKSERDAAESAQSKLEQIQSQLKGRLATLVAERQAAARRAEEARARAAAQAQAQAQARAAAAQQAQAAATQAQTPSVSVPPVITVPETTPVDPPVVPSGSGAGARAVAAAASQLGVPYVWGGSSPSGFDCSGLTQWAWGQAGVSLGRTTYAQRYDGPSVSLAQAQPGDLVFYNGFGHMAIYAGGGQIIHAPHTGDVVRYASVYIDGGPILIVRPG